MGGDGRAIRVTMGVAAWVLAVAAIATLGWRFRRAARRSALMAVGVLPLVAGVDGAFAQTSVPARGAMDPCTRVDNIDDVDESARSTMLQQIKDRLGLTEDQVQNIEALRQARGEAIRRDTRALCEAGVELGALIASFDSDPTAVRAAGEKAKTALGRVLDHRIDGQLDLRARLTPEQWARWIDLLQDIHEGQGTLGAAVDVTEPLSNALLGSNPRSRRPLDGLEATQFHQQPGGIDDDEQHL